MERETLRFSALFFFFNEKRDFPDPKAENAVFIFRFLLNENKNPKKSDLMKASAVWSDFHTEKHDS